MQLMAARDTYAFGRCKSKRRRVRTLRSMFEEEPVLGGAHPLLHMDNVVCTPHLGYVERDGLRGLELTSRCRVCCGLGSRSPMRTHTHAGARAVLAYD